jgi:hypothetical protein
VDCFVGYGPCNDEVGAGFHFSQIMLWALLISVPISAQKAAPQF